MEGEAPYLLQVQVKAKASGSAEKEVRVTEQEEKYSPKITWSRWEKVEGLGDGSHSGKNNLAALAIAERSTGMVINRKFQNSKCAEDVNKAVIEELGHIKKYVKSITADNGPEFIRFHELESALNTKIFFLPKKLIDILSCSLDNIFPNGWISKIIDTKEIDRTQGKINKKLRKKLNFRTPEFSF